VRAGGGRRDGPGTWDGALSVVGYCAVFQVLNLLLGIGFRLLS